MKEDIPIVASFEHCVLQGLFSLPAPFFDFVDLVLQLLLLLQLLELDLCLLVLPPPLLFLLLLPLLPGVDFLFF